MTSRALLVGLPAAVLLAGFGYWLVSQREPAEAAAGDDSADPTETFAGPAPDQPAPDEPAAQGTGEPPADPQELDRLLARHFRQRADECVRQMHQRAPHAQGLLALELRVQRGAGGLAEIEDVQTRQDNELEDASLLDCLAGAPFALPGLTSVRGFELVLPVEPKGH